VTKLAATMHRRNGLLLDELERISVQDAGQRPISFLESQAAEEGMPLRFPKRILAARLSIRPETSPGSWLGSRAAIASERWTALCC